MDVIIFADREGQELLPLTDQTSVALLPLAGKLILEHTLEALVDVGVRQAHIILSPFADQVKLKLGDGMRWGMTLTYSTSRGEESTQQEFSKLQIPLSFPFLMLRGDVIRSGSVKDFIEQAQLLTASCIQALYGGENAYMLLCNNAVDPDFDTLNWTDSVVLAKTTVDVPGYVSRIDSLVAFYQANLDAAARRLDTLLIPGRETALGLTQGRNTEVYPQNIKQGIALIGSNCHIHPSVELIGEVVIGDHVIIDKRATIESSVILPHTYVGELIELRNAIVRGNDLIRVDNGSILKISDTFLLADLTTTYFNTGLGPFFNRTAGLFLLTLSLPFWFLALGLVLKQNPSKPFLVKRLRGNKIVLNDFGVPERIEFTAVELNVNPPVLRYLPRVLAVVNGDINLMGSLPVSFEVAKKRTQEWERLADQTPSGLLGPTQLNVPADASEEEILMSDSVYAAQVNIRTNLRYLLTSIQALISRKAWIN